MEDASSQDIKKFWNENPVGSNFIQYRKDQAFYEEYDRFRYSTEGHILKELDKTAFENKLTLEIGLGQGSDGMEMIRRGAIYAGVDLTEESVKRVKERFELFDLSYDSIQVANARSLPFESAYFDIVYSHGVIHHSPHIQEIVHEIHRVLKPGGLAVVMLYHKHSFNYFISIGLLRRAGLLALVPFPFLSKLISRVTGEDSQRILSHRQNILKDGWKYLTMKNFIHRSTDGPDNVHSSVWTEKTARNLFKDFDLVTTNVQFLNERHLMGLQKLLPDKFKRRLAKKAGWHLWIRARKY